MTAGGRKGRGLSRGAGRTDLVGDRGPDSCEPCNCMEDIFGRSFGRVFGIGGGSLFDFASHDFSGFGAGDTARGGGVLLPVSVVLLMFSNRARNEDTGFYASGQ
jgi:hypothetical protein